MNTNPHRREREPDEEEWLRNMREQPEAVARLLASETRNGGLYVSENGYVWHGGIGPGYGTSFKLIPRPEGERTVTPVYVCDHSHGPQ